MDREYQFKYNCVVFDILKHRENLHRQWAYEHYCREFDIWDFM